MIKDGSNVKLHYTLTVEDQLLEDSKKSEALNYVHGQGQIIPGLEEELAGLQAGDTKSAVVPPEKGYGMHDPRGLQEVSRESFKDADALKVGDVVSGQSGEQTVHAAVAEVKPEAVVLDLNHPLAGKTLHFSVEIIEVS